MAQVSVPGSTVLHLVMSTCQCERILCWPFDVPALLALNALRWKRDLCDEKMLSSCHTRFKPIKVAAA